MRRFGCEWWRAFGSDVGHGERRLFAETTLADDALFDVDGCRKELTVE